MTVIQEPLRNNHSLSDHFVMDLYAGHGISLLQLFLNDGLHEQKGCEEES